MSQVAAQPTELPAPPIEVRGLTKRFGEILAVDGLGFAVRPGTVTGFLGPNGAGKTTTLRMLVGLVAPTAGEALVEGVRYRELDDPARTVGAVLEAAGFHPARTARQHLRSVAAAAGIAAARVAEVLDMVGLDDARDRRVGGYSLGMRQRLQLAEALLGDPRILVLDEPSNGLDPQGIAWMRGFLRWFASRGRAVLVSSHLLAEAAQTVDEVIVLAHGRLVGHGVLDELLAGMKGSVRVRTPDAVALLHVLGAAGLDAHEEAPGVVVAEGATAEVVGPIIAEHRIVVHEMASSGESLEQLFFAMTEGAAPDRPRPPAAPRAAPEVAP
jgi:ABC-2 type transport system ATP-binding protein